MLSGKNNAISNAFLVKESELGSSSYEEFVDSDFEGSPLEDSGNLDSLVNEFSAITTLTTTIVPNSLESLLNNLSLDKPIISTPQPAITRHHEYTVRRNNSISWLGTAFKWEKSHEGNLVIDAGSSDAKPIILYASKMKLIEKLTTILDYKFMDDFLLTVEMIMHPMDFAVCLLSRLAQAFKAVSGWNSEEEIDPEVVKMRGLIVLQHWAGICGPDIESSMDFSIRKVIIETLDIIWQQSRTLSQSDQRFLIKIRRLYDPRGEISTTSPVDLDTASVGAEDISSVFESNDFVSGSERDKSFMKWSSKLKLRLKSIFNKKSSSRSFGSPQSSSSLLINSFSSEVECEDVSNVLINERSRNLASILAVVEWDIFQSIQRAELVYFPSARESPQRLIEECPNLQRAIEHFNSMCQWFVQLIINQDDANDVTLLAKLIRLAVKCVMIHNYNTALQIILALQSPHVSSRKNLWMALPSWERRLAKDLAVFGSPVKNFKNVRKALDESGHDEQRNDLIIPFNGLFLSDLVFNWERSNNSTDPVNDNMIAFYKNHVAAKIIRQFLSFKSATKNPTGKVLSAKERQLYSYFADIGRLGGEFSM